MKRKLLVLIFALFIPCMFVFSACNDEVAKIELDSSMINLKYYTTTYNGFEKEPTLTVKIGETIVNESEYEISYSNNIDAGTASVRVLANEDSELISGSAIVTFTIQPSITTASSYETLAEILSNPNYKSVLLTNNVVIPSGTTLTVPEGKSINCNNFTISGNIVNNGSISVNVNSVETLKAAYEFANIINVVEDIKSQDTSYLGDITLKSTERDYNLEINLNHHIIEAELDFMNYKSSKNNVASYYDYGINVIIRNGTIGGKLNDAGILVKGNEKINVELYNCTLEGTDAGLLTNGTCKGATIKAISCKFIGNNEDDARGQTDGASGVYLPSKDNFEFINCSFSGLTGYYAKSGNHNLQLCTFNATATSYAEPKHNGNGCNETGSALVIDSAAGYQSPLNIEVISCKFNSVAGHGVEIYTTGSTEPYSNVELVGQQIYKVALENTRYW